MDLLQLQQSEFVTMADTTIDTPQRREIRPPEAGPGHAKDAGQYH